MKSNLRWTSLLLGFLLVAAKVAEAAVPEGLCESAAKLMITRPDHMFGRQALVHDVSPSLRKRTLPTGLKVFAIKDLFSSSNEVLIGFGKPNLFLVVPDGQGGYLKYAAKSLWRGPSKIEADTKLIQSGILLRLTGLSEGAIENLRLSMKLHEGEKTATCIQANCKVLADAGFTDGEGNTLTNNIFAYMFGRKLMASGGLRYEGAPVSIEIFRTTNWTWQDYTVKVISAEARAPLRHLKRAVGLSEGKDSEPAPTPSTAIVKHPGAQNGQELSLVDLEMSEPSRLGVLLRLMWGPHALFKINNAQIRPEQFFDHTLREFDQVDPSLATRLKQNFLFSKPVVSMIISNLQNSTTRFGAQSEDTVFNMMEVDSPETPNKHNIVITDEGAAIARLNIRNKFVDWLLTKHVLMTNYSKSVWFAGEIWKDADGLIHVNANSGTYRPTEEELQKAILYLQALFPNTRFQIEL